MINLLRFGFALTLLAVTGCVAPQAGPPAPALEATAAAAPPFRPDLDPKWRDGAGAIRWPANDGFAAAPLLLELEPGMLIDRFGKDTGHFLSPKGAGYGQRALPYVCKDMPYHVYRIEQPLLAWTGKAAAWFDQPGGATQIETDASVAQLLADGTIAAVTVSGATPCS
jgi:streptomycin 6-kinase